MSQAYNDAPDKNFLDFGQKPHPFRWKGYALNDYKGSFVQTLEDARRKYSAFLVLHTERHQVDVEECDEEICESPSGERQVWMKFKVTNREAA